MINLKPPGGGPNREIEAEKLQTLLELREVKERTKELAEKMNV